jgi:hypothetical protein
MKREIACLNFTVVSPISNKDALPFLKNGPLQVLGAVLIPNLAAHPKEHNRRAFFSFCRVSS